MRSSFARSHRCRSWCLVVALLAGACGNADGSAAPVGASVTSTVMSGTATGAPETGAGDTVNGWFGQLGFEVLDVTPHDSSAFTQGLELVDGVLVESTGLYGSSDRRRVDPRTGTVLARIDLEPELFGEGVTERDGRLYQLTWQAGRLLVSDAETLAEVDDIGYTGEGWGICTADDWPGRPFIMSDGSATLTVRDPNTFSIRDQLRVQRSDGSDLTALNELECVGSQIVANVWKSTEIVLIDMATGSVDATVDLTDLVPAGIDVDREVLNGIAHDAGTGTFYVTGKNWPVMYRIRLTTGD